MDRILDVLLPVGSVERAEHDLPAYLRPALDYHRSRTADIISRLEEEHGSPDAAYAAFLDGDENSPRMPAALRSALGIVDPPVITSRMTSDETARVWAEFAHGSSA